MIELKITKEKAADVLLATILLICSVISLVFGVDMALSEWHEGIAVFNFAYCVVLFFVSVLFFLFSMNILGLVKFKGDSNEGNL